MKIYGSIRDKFQVTKYAQIPADRFDELLSFLGVAAKGLQRPGLPEALSQDLELATDVLLTRMVAIKEAIDHLKTAYGDGMEIFKGVVKMNTVAARLKGSRCATGMQTVKHVASKEYQGVIPGLQNKALAADINRDLVNIENGRGVFETAGALREVPLG